MHLGRDEAGDDLYDIHFRRTQVGTDKDCLKRFLASDHAKCVTRPRHQGGRVASKWASRCSSSGAASACSTASSPSAMTPSPRSSRSTCAVYCRGRQWRAPGGWVGCGACLDEAVQTRGRQSSGARRRAGEKLVRLAGWSGVLRCGACRRKGVAARRGLAGRVGWVGCTARDSAGCGAVCDTCRVFLVGPVR